MERKYWCAEGRIDVTVADDIVVAALIAGWVDPDRLCEMGQHQARRDDQAISAAVEAE